MNNKNYTPIKPKRSSALLEEREKRLIAEKSNYYRVERELTHQEVIELYQKTKKELDELKAWKEEVTEVMNKFKLQEIGKELQLPLGSDIPSQILPEIKRIKAITDEAISLLAAKDRLYKAALDEIIKLKTK